MNKAIRQLLLISVCALAPPQAIARPNLVVIFTDDQVFNAVGYDNPEIQTPNLDALAKSGVIFERAYVASPICAASRASMMTGLYPQQHGVIALNQKSFQDNYWNGKGKASQTLAHRLSKAGYHTAAYGKSHLGNPTNFGFDEGAQTGPHDDVETFARIKQFIGERAASDKPFFLWLAPHQPHVPLLPGQKWLELYDPEKLTLSPNFRDAPLQQSLNNQGKPGEHYYRDSKYIRNVDKLSAGPPRDRDIMRRFMQAYHAVVSHLDHQIGGLVQELKDTGLWENTVLIFLSDNGYHLGSHGLGNKITMHEESVRVPMFATGPGIARSQRTKSLVSSLDVFPTLLELAGEDVPETVMGKSLAGIFAVPKTRVRQTIFSECVGVGGKPGEGHRMAFDGRHKLMLSGTNERYLFDHRNDAAELNNLINRPEHAKVAKRLESELADWMRLIGDRDIQPVNK
jgi:arylsulfatase A-like enzyme